jgi:dihydrofolate reductase
MGKLTYLAISSLDGYATDRSGGFNWAEPSDEVHTFIENLERDTGTMLYGRRLYETMAVWETLGEEPDSTDVMRNYAEMWKAHQKIVYSSSLASVWTSRTDLVRSFDPAEVRAAIDAADHDATVGGATLAAQALRAGIVDEIGLVVFPALIGSGGLPIFPGDVDLRLALLDERRFSSGVVYLRYAVDR